VVNAKFYVIYRSKVSGGPYTKIATTTTTKYVDHNVIAGTTYYYVAISCDGVSLSSYSNQASADARR
jgi:fibronectin type 3 domain-containing protein